MRFRRWVTVVGVLASASVLGAVACDLNLKPYADPNADSGAPAVVPGTVDSGGNNPNPSDPDFPGPVDAGPDAEAGGNRLRKRVFLTSTLVNGSLGGLVGADGVCQTRANAAALNGAFIAWLSVMGTPAVSRILTDGPWYLVDRQTLVFPTRAAMITPGPAVKIDRDEGGTPRTGAVWTGTLANGNVAQDTCSGWGSNSPLDDGLVGNSEQNAGTWTQLDNDPCASAHRLYCIEQ